MVPKSVEHGAGDGPNISEDCSMTDEELHHNIIATVQKQISEIMAQLTSSMCLECHTNLASTSLCPCPNCNRIHGPN